MATLGDFLQTLFEEGRIVLFGRPEPSEADRPAALRVLEAAFDLLRLDVAGPPIPFDARSALAAAELVRLAGWFLVNRSESVREMDRSLSMPRPPFTAGEHLSAGRLVPSSSRRSTGRARIRSAPGRPPGELPGRFAPRLAALGRAVGPGGGSEGDRRPRRALRTLDALRRAASSRREARLDA